LVLFRIVQGIRKVKPVSRAALPAPETDITSQYRDNHEQECSQIQNEILYTKAERAASVAQQVFYTLMEKTWTLDVGFIDYLNPNDALEWVQVQASIGAEEGPGGGSLQPRLAGGWLVKFPEQKINPDAKEAVLADRNSVWQFVAMHVTMSYLFRCKWNWTGRKANPPRCWRNTSLT
jgi:hypothetical protein